VPDLPKRTCNPGQNMDDGKLRIRALNTVVILASLLALFTQGAGALTLEPSHISGPEGSVIGLNILIEADDWVEPNQEYSNKCAAAGLDAQLVARYFLRRVSGSANFSITASNGDLHLASSGIPKSDLYVLWCAPGWFPVDQLDTERSIVFHEDNESEGTETATLEIFKLDLEGNKTFVTSSTIAISDSGGSKNSNHCSSAPLGSDSPGLAGSITTSDCDDSPRGSGYLADTFTFAGSKGEPVVIQADWTNLDGYLYLEAPDGSIEDQNDNFADTSVSIIERNLGQSGTYTLWATTNDKNDTGDYRVSLTRPQDPQNLVDWSLTVQAVTPTDLIRKDTLSITVVGQSDAPASLVSGGSVDVLYLLSEDNLIAENDTLLGSENHCCATGFDGSWQGVLDVDPGTYWVGACITKNDADQTNNCTVGTQITVSESLAGACNSRVIDCGTPVTASLNDASCTSGPQGPGYFVEKFSFLAEPGATFWLDATWDFDGYLFLKDPRGRLIAENDNYSGAANARIEYTPEESGTYTAWATSFEPGTRGDFELSLTCKPSSGPDLVFGMPEVQTETLVPGQGVALSVQMHNTGDQPADTASVHFLLSSDSRVDLTDSEIGYDGEAGLQAGESVTVEKLLPSPVTPGEYWVGVCADPVAGESAVSNNCSAGVRIEISAQPECNEVPVYCGQTLNSIINAKDCTRSPRGGGFLAEALEVDLDAGTSLTADAGWSGMDGFLLLEDPSGAIVESNDDAGDTAHSRIEYTVQNSGVHRFWTTSFQQGRIGSYEFELNCTSSRVPDLSASAVSLSSGETLVAQTVSLSTEVHNDGKISSEAGNLHVMLSSDEQISADDLIIDSQALASIPPESGLSLELMATLPERAGDYWLGICVDAVPGEVVTWNNCSHSEPGVQQSSVQSGTGNKPGSQSSAGGTLVKVSSGTACTSSGINCRQTRSGTLGQSDCDSGLRGTGYFSDNYSFYGIAGDTISLNADWNGMDGYLHLVGPRGGLLAENDDFNDPQHSRLEYVLQQSGNYLLWASANDQGEGGSYEISMDCDSPVAPDLLVSTPQLGVATIRPGESLSMSTEVFNQGNETSAGTSVRFILAGGSALSPADQPLGKTDVPAMPPGESSVESISLVLDVAPGTYHIAACADADVLELNSLNNCAISEPLTVEESGRPIEINPGLNDAWYNPATSGQGFFINVFPDNQQIFLSWFTFDVERPDPGVPFELGDSGHRWLTALGAYQRGVANLKIYLNEGGAFDQATPVPTESLYGSMVIRFSDCNHGQIEFDIPSINEKGTIPITRLAMDNLKACENYIGAPESSPEMAVAQTVEPDGAVSPAVRITSGLNDAWYNPANPGQGFAFSVFPRLGNVFASWFTYDTERPPEEVNGVIGGPGQRWLTALGSFDGDTAELKLFSVGGGIFNAAEPAPVETKFGTVKVHFNDCNSGELEYDIPTLARQGVVPIQRLATDGVPVCEATQEYTHREGLGVSPGNKGVLANFCGNDETWRFDWPDVPQASGYVLELWRNDALIPMSFSVHESAFLYQKEIPVSTEHLTGWKWRYRPQYTGTGKAAEFSQAFTFDVGACE